MECLTYAAISIAGQTVASVARACVRSRGVGTRVFTEICTLVALVDFCGEYILHFVYPFIALMVLPAHVWPSLFSLYPVLQLHVKEPALLLHTCWQLLVEELAHSLTSANSLNTRLMCLQWTPLS